MVFQAASSSLDPVFSIKQQFQQILDRHGFEGDADEIAAASVKSVGLYPGTREISTRAKRWNETTRGSGNGTILNKINIESKI